jgi:hypothetical protein
MTKHRKPLLDAGDALRLFAVCWFALLLFCFSAWEGLGIAYLLASVCAGFGYAIDNLTPRPERPPRSPDAPVEPDDPDATAQFDALLAFVEHKMLSLEDIERKHGADVRTKVEEALQQQEYLSSQEVSR